MANTRQEIVDELKQILEQDAADIKEQVDHLKTRFYSTEPAEGEGCAAGGQQP